MSTVRRIEKVCDSYVVPFVHKGAYNGMESRRLDLSTDIWFQEIKKDLLLIWNSFQTYRHMYLSCEQTSTRRMNEE